MMDDLLFFGPQSLIFRDFWWISQKCIKILDGNPKNISLLLSAEDLKQNLVFNIYLEFTHDK